MYKSFLATLLSYLIIAHQTFLLPERYLSLLHMLCRHRHGTVTHGMPFQLSCQSGVDSLLELHLLYRRTFLE